MVYKITNQNYCRLGNLVEFDRRERNHTYNSVLTWVRSGTEIVIPSIKIITILIE